MEELLGLYLHIPFCTKKCNYCGFFSIPINEEAFFKYYEGLKKEIEFFKDFGFKFDTLFVGGGTPTSLKPVRLAKIFNLLINNFDLSRLAEFTVEANPESLTLDHLKVFKDSGVTRISIGAQSFHNSELTILGRPHTVEDIYRAFTITRESGFKNINLDILFGFDGQTLKSFEKTLLEIVKLNPEHVSTYSLSYEKGAKTDLRMRDEDTLLKMFTLRDEILTAHGLERYEISNYAKPGFESKHNLKYWMRKFYIGLGPSASGYYLHRGKHIRYTNTSNFNEYPEKKEILEELNEEQILMEEIFLRLRTKWGLQIKSKEILDRISNTLGEFLEIRGNTIILNEKGILLHDTIALKIGEIYEGCRKKIHI